MVPRFNKLGQRGYSLVEVMVGVGILGILVLVGLSAYQYFNKETQQKISELNATQQFALLTKDLLSFSESAGLSTLYLNMPIRVRDCEPGRPCLSERGTVPATDCPEGQQCPAVPGWVPVATDSIPRSLQNQPCTQFYRDSFGRLITKPAFPDTSTSFELTPSFRDFRHSSADRDLTLTWPLLDETSAPLLLLKVRSISSYFSLNGGMSFGRESLLSSANADPTMMTAVFDSEMSPKEAEGFVGYPMLFYGAQFQGHFAYYYAHSILACADNVEACLREVADKVYRNPDGGELPVSIRNSITARSFVINLRPIDQTSAFFSEIYSRVNVPAGEDLTGCHYSWGAKQEASQYLFPSGLLSIYNTNVPISEVNPDSRGYFNPTAYNKYAAYEMPNSSNQAPFAQLLPVDLIRYSIERTDSGGDRSPKRDLVARLWHATEEKKITKITNLTAPFYFTRKLGSSEFGIEYSPRPPKVATPGESQ